MRMRDLDGVTQEYFRLFLSKEVCAFPMVISSQFHMDGIIGKTHTSLEK